jgi:hypothetical protein
MSFSTIEAMNASNLKSIDNGSRQTLGKGDLIKFTDLPNQPIALVAYNTTGNTTPYVISYNNEKPEHYTIESVEKQGFSLGNAFLINPEKTGAQEISVSVPNTAQSTASIEVYLVSLYLPTSGINNISVPLNGEMEAFDGYSRAYATPPLAWYTMSIHSSDTGLVGFKFNNDEIEIIAVNVNPELVPALKSKIHGNKDKTGIQPSAPIVVSGNTYNHDFYGTSSQIVYSPVSSANTTRNGSISIQKL